MRPGPGSSLVAGLWRCVWSPALEFRLLAAQEPPWASSLGWLLALRAPVAFLEILFTCLAFGRTYTGVLRMEGPVWNLALSWLPRGASEVRDLLQTLPVLPSLGRVWPWLLLAAPFYVLSLWLHDAVWDHGCLWLLGGLKEHRGFATTLTAEAEALQVGVFGALLGLLGSLPWVGWLLSPPLALVGVYFWILRGFALAAFHHCPAWKGVVATVLHGAVAACCALAALLGLLVLLVRGLA